MLENPEINRRLIMMEIPEPVDNLQDLEDLFYGTQVEQVARFYHHFEDAASILKWVRERKNGRADIFEVDGDRNIVVVIPTRDHHGKYSLHCSNHIFKGFQQVFVESGSDIRGFNYARNCNIGLKRALKYQPSWIILSNDDMYMIDKPETLTGELAGKDPERYVSLFTSPPGDYHSYLGGFGLTTHLRNLALRVTGNLQREQLQIEQKFSIRIVPAYPNRIRRILSKRNRFFHITSSFSIFSGKFVKEKSGAVFDEMFLNMWEDTDISYQISRNPEYLSFINYRIGDMIGSSFGNTGARHLRSMVSRIYFNIKYGHLFE